VKSPSTPITVICALAAIGAGILSWQQHLELVVRRATALEGDDRAALQKRLWDSEKRVRSLESAAAAADNVRKAEKTDEGKPLEPTARVAAASAKAGPSPVEIMAFLNNPETLRALNGKFREQVETRYAGLFKALNLPPAQLAQFKDLLLERQATAFDVASAALAQGMKPNQEELRQLVATAQSETDRKMAAALGTTGYSQFQAYENAQLFRGATTSLQAGLARVSAPLTDEQAEQFTTGIATLAQTSFTPVQQKALQELTLLQQSRQTLQQVEQLYRDKQTPVLGKKPGP
jgi:hypothetical protein